MNRTIALALVACASKAPLPASAISEAPVTAASPVGVVFEVPQTEVVYAGRRCWVEAGVWCEGANQAGQSGHPEMTATAPARLVGVPAGTRGLVLNATRSCQLGNAGLIWCWGEGDPAPRQLPLEAPAVDLALGLEGWCAVLKDGRVQCADGVRAGIAADAITFDGRWWCARSPDGPACWEG